MNSPALSIVTVSMGRLAHLKETVPLVASQRGVEHIVVDYSCPEGSGHWVRRAFPQVTVCFVEGQRYFNVSKGRNAGSRLASCDWLCFLDADVKVHSRFIETILPLLSSNSFYRHPRGNKSCLNGFVVCSKSDYVRVGGYDERCEGHGWEDNELYVRFKELGIREQHLPEFIVTAIEHSDHLRTQFYENKDMQATCHRNYFICRGKKWSEE